MKLIQDLKLMGLKVRAAHLRHYSDKCFTTSPMTKEQAAGGGFNSSQPLTKGGVTLVEIFNVKEQKVAEGSAVCSKEDNYNKKLGMRIALGRALKDFQS